MVSEIPSWLKDTTDRLTETPEKKETEVLKEVPPMDAPMATPPMEIPTAIESQERATEAIPAPAPAPASELPSWLVGSNIDTEPPSVSVTGEQVTEVPETSHDAEFPQVTSVASENQWETLDTKAEMALLEEPAPMLELAKEATVIPVFSPSEMEMPTPVTEPAPTPVNDELPDWLKSFAPTPVAEPMVEDAPIPEAAPMAEDDIFGDAEIVKAYGFPESSVHAEVPAEVSAEPVKAPKPKKQKAPAPMPEIKPTANTDDLPDWLK